MSLYYSVIDVYQPMKLPISCIVSVMLIESRIP